MMTPRGCNAGSSGFESQVPAVLALEQKRMSEYNVVAVVVHQHTDHAGLLSPSPPLSLLFIIIPLELAVRQ